MPERGQSQRSEIPDARGRFLSLTFLCANKEKGGAREGATKSINHRVCLKARAQLKDQLTKAPNRTPYLPAVNHPPPEIS